MNLITVCLYMKTEYVKRRTFGKSGSNQIICIKNKDFQVKRKMLLLSWC